MPSKVDPVALQVEAVLFASGRPLSVKELTEALNVPDYRVVQRALRTLDQTYGHRQTALEHPVGSPFPFLSLWNPLQGRDRLVALFLAVLFLARERSIELRQETLGVSPVLVVRTAETRAPVVEEP